MKLTEKDLKLRTYIYHSKREPITKIAKETGLTRIQVEYTLKKFQKEKKQFFKVLTTFIQEIL